MHRKQVEDEPKSWADILKQKEAEYNKPPPPSFYVKEKIVTHEEAGIFPEPAPETPSNSDIYMDTHYYATTNIFDPEEEKPRNVRPSKDHGKDLLTWGKKKPFDDEEKPRMMTRINPFPQNDDYNQITGVHKNHQFKNTVNQILKQRETNQKVMSQRTFDPISNTFPSDELEVQRTTKELSMRTAQLDFQLSKLPPNERRAHDNTVNIITGQASDEEIASEFVKPFPSMNIERSKESIRLEKEIVTHREEDFQKHLAMVGCRYNTEARQKELRDFDIINGQSKRPCMDASVRMKPTAWEWCKTERLQ